MHVSTRRSYCSIRVVGLDSLHEDYIDKAIFRDLEVGIVESSSSRFVRGTLKPRVSVYEGT